MAKEFECNIIVSSETVKLAGLEPDPITERTVDIRGREDAITVLALNSINEISGFHEA